MCGPSYIPAKPLPLKGKRVYIGGAFVAIGGTIGALLQGADWNSLFSAEGAAVAGASVVLLRAVVALVAKVRANRA